MQIINDYFGVLNVKIKLLPPEFKWLFWFSVPLYFLSVLSLLFARVQFYEEIIPYIGWNPGFIYAVCAFIAVKKTSIATMDSTFENFRNIRYKVVFLLGIYFLTGVYDWFNTTPDYYTHTNPYLRYEPLRPIFAIYLPLFWIFIIGLPLLKNFYSTKSKVLV